MLSLAVQLHICLKEYLVIQLAKYSGFDPIIITSSLKHADDLKSLGAAHVIDHNASDMTEVRKFTENPILIVYDAISISSADTQQAGIDVLATGGSSSQCRLLA